jgi:hypothetical protein
MNRMRQVGVWMRAYSLDNRDLILPSQFDYSENPYSGTVRTGQLAYGGPQNVGTWADILWAENEIIPLSQANGIDNYRYDSPDYLFYRVWAAWDDNPLRSSAPNSKNTPGVSGDPGTDALALPWGDGAQEIGYPGYFAANNFFDSRPDSDVDEDGNRRPLWYSNGQISRPDQSMYLVDSFAGEVIEDTIEAWSNLPEDGDDATHVDFRYNGLCLMLFMDGHVDPVNSWLELSELEGCFNSGTGDVEKGRDIRVRRLDSRNRPPCE